MFSDVLLTVDFDRTLTAPDSTIPARNLEAIRYFMENGGAFTVNTGRSLPMATVIREQVPMNAPILLYNGGLAYDLEKEEIVFSSQIDLNMEATMRQLEEIFPHLVTEVEGIQAHYLFKENPMWNDFCANNRCEAKTVEFGADLGPFLKFCVYGPLRDNTVAGLYRGSDAEMAYYDEVEAQIRSLYGADTEVYRAAPRIVDVHPKGASKLNAARKLQEMLGRKILVCAGDGENDLSMMQGADYAWCPADSRLVDRFPSVCDCADGAVADIIFRKIPKILKKQLDKAPNMC